MKSLSGAAFDFYSCFISYSNTDHKFAHRLYADLQARGVRRRMISMVDGRSTSRSMRRSRSTISGC
jgi:hypothetical protein